MTARFILAVLLGCLVVGCGGEKLTTEDRVIVSGAIADLALADLAAIDPDGCREDHGADCDVVDGGAAVDTLIRIYREKPEATYETERDGSRTMRQVVIDEANDLREYSPGLAAKLELAVED